MSLYASINNESFNSVGCQKEINNRRILTDDYVIEVRAAYANSPLTELQFAKLGCDLTKATYYTYYAILRNKTYKYLLPGTKYREDYDRMSVVKKSL